MLTSAGCKVRQARLWEKAPAEVEWIVVADPRHLRYLVNFGVQPLSFSNGERALLLLEREAGTTLIADNFTVRSATGPHFADREVIDTWYDHKRSVVNRDHSLFRAVKSIVEKFCDRLGAVEAEWLPVGALEAMGSLPLASDDEPSEDEFDVGTVLRGLRRKKEPDEIELLKLCMKATEAGHARAREVIRPGISELEVFTEVQAACQRAAGRAVLIYGDFRATNAAQPKAGGLPTAYVLKDEDLFILDYSVVIDGYRSDFTNTYAVGTPTKEQAKLFSQLQSAMAAGEAVLRAGVRASEVHAAASAPLVDAGLGPIPHHAGHGIGLAHPEPPILVPQSDDLLAAGDVVTLEPGMYPAGIGGIRIERNYLITETGFETLSHHRIALTSERL